MLSTCLQWGGRYSKFAAWEIQVGPLILISKQVSLVGYFKDYI
jgi:hypothetical protein